MPESINEQQPVIKPLTQEDYQCQQHEEYLQKVAESGVPLWVLDSYNSGGY